MIEASFSEIISVLPPERRYKLMASRACRVSEARYLHYLLQCAKDEVKPTVKNILVHREGNALPALATAITKPDLIGKWEGEPTSVVIRSRYTRLQGMIVYDGLPLRPMRRDAVYPSQDMYMASSDVEGAAISELAEKMGYEVELNKPFMDVLSQLLQYHQIEVGSEFWSNIDTFTQGLIDREIPSRRADY